MREAATHSYADPYAYSDADAIADAYPHAYGNAYARTPWPPRPARTSRSPWW